MILLLLPAENPESQAVAALNDTGNQQANDAVSIYIFNIK